MNLVKRSLMEGGKKKRVIASAGIGALIGILLLRILNLLTWLWLANSSYSLIGLARELTQGLY